MIKDKFSAVWVSHSSIGDYLRCPRAYYLNNVYRNPDTNRKIALIKPQLALGQAVHEVIETISVKPAEVRFRDSLIPIYEKAWQKVSGKRGGFHSEEEETGYKSRGQRMIEKVMTHPGPLANKAVKIQQDLPYFWLSEEDNIILCGKIDWLEYLPETESVAIIDFKTGKFEEDPSSLQLPIYFLLVKNCQRRPVTAAYYWYLNRANAPQPVPLPDEQVAYTAVLEIAKKIALARKLEHFMCKSKDGCVVCRPLEKIVRGEATYVGSDEYNRDIYIL